MLALDSVVIYIQFSVWRWNFDLILNASMMTARAAMKVYIFHSRQFRAPVMSPFFHPHEPFDDAPWMIYVHVSTRRDTLLMESLTRTLG